MSSPPGSPVIDVGANLGLSTILLARLAERVVAFEPPSPNVHTSDIADIVPRPREGVAMPTFPSWLRRSTPLLHCINE